MSEYIEPEYIDPVLKGGPYDGLELDPMVPWRDWVYVNHRDYIVAVYIVDPNNFANGTFNYDFARYQKRGEGVQPDVYPNRGAA